MILDHNPKNAHFLNLPRASENHGPADQQRVDICSQQVIIVIGYEKVRVS